MSIYQSIAELEVKGETGAFCIVVRTSGSTPRHEASKMMVYPDGSIIGTVGGGEIENRVKSEALLAIRDGIPRFLHYELVDPEKGDPGICGGTMEVYVEPILPKPSLIIIGGGHVGKAVAKLGKFCGFQVVVSDDRPEFCVQDEYPDADLIICGPMKDLPQKIRITPWTFVAVTTRGSDIDIEGLPAIIHSKPRYIGVIGSKRRWITTKKALLAAGLAEEELKRVISPIGLYIGAESPEEIAVSIIAEVIMAKMGIPLKNTTQTDLEVG